MTRAEILRLSTGKTWKDHSIHILLNSMLDKGVILVDGYASSGTNYGRTYRAAITREAYAAERLRNTVADITAQSVALPSVFSALLEDVDEGTLSALAQILEDKKKELQAGEQSPGADSGRKAR